MNYQVTTEETVKGILTYLKNVPPEERKKVLETLGKNAPSQKTVAVVSAIVLSPSEIEQIKNFVKRKGYNSGEIEFKIDKTILGGLKIRLGDNLIDRSLAGLLSQYQNKLTE